MLDINILNNIIIETRNDITFNKKKIKKIGDRVEKILLDKMNNIILNGGGNIKGTMTKTVKDIEDSRVLLQELLKTYDDAKLFERNLDMFLKKIKEIEQTTLPPSAQQFVDFNNQIKSIKLQMNDYVNGKNMIANTNKTEFLVTDRGRWENLLIIFKTFVFDYNGILEEIAPLKDNNIIHEKITEKIRNDIIRNLDLLSEFKIFLDKIKVEFANKVKLLDDQHIEFTPDDIYYVPAKEKDTIYNYTERFTLLNTNKLHIVEQNNVDRLTTNYSSILQSLSIVNLSNMAKGLGQMPPIYPQSHQYTNTYQYMNGGSDADIMNQLLKLGTLLNDVNKEMGTVKKYIDAYTQLEIRYNYHLIYLTIITNPPVTNMMLYKYINKGLIQFYLTIMLNIMKLIRNQSPTAEYFNIYHYVTLQKLIYFCQYLVKNMNSTDIIDIAKCKNNPSKLFLLLNNFKDILESYNEVVQNKVTIYARINDWNLSNKDLLFSKNSTDARKLHIDIKYCKKIDTSNDLYKKFSSNQGSDILFTEVFDTQEFPKNGVISKYMTLETQLSQQKGIMLMTYGYSGTGKTFTLFGSRRQNKEGILQSTLNGIRGLDKIKLRVYELYGKGVQYPHYWTGTSTSSIDQKIIYHKLQIQKDTNELLIESSQIDENIMRYVNDTKTYIDINGINTVNNVFKNFDIFVDKLDQLRRQAGRIRITPNNPESSRSIIIYDLLLLVETRYVPFVIIDLPGREEIVQTYVDNFLDKPHVKNMYNTPFDRALLSSMAINPLGLAILVPTEIFNTFDNLPIAIRKAIMTTPLNDDMQHKTVRFIDEGMSTNGHSINTMRFLYDFPEGWYNDPFFSLINNHNYVPNTNQRNGEDRIVKIKDYHMNPNTSQINPKINNVQYQGVLALFVINRLIVLGRFDVLEQIYRNIVSKYYNFDYERSQIVNNDPSTRQFLSTYFDNSKIDQIMKSTDQEKDYYLNNLINYNSIEAPFEGIYINENIVGLIKFLSKNVLNKSDDEIKKNLAVPQNKDLGFTEQKENIRQMNYVLYNYVENNLIYITPQEQQEHARSYSNILSHNNISQDNLNYTPYENIARNNNVLEKLYLKAKNDYSSQKIFRYDNPGIGDILSYYLQEKKIDNPPVVIVPVTKFKMFYLLSNTEMDKKCDHQIKLLDNTINLLDAIENT